MKYYYLLIKKCSVNGKKYLCKRLARNDNEAIRYTGSGKIVLRLKKKYGSSCMEHFSILAKFPENQQQEFSVICKNYSKKFNIVESNDWLNLIEENGYHGGSTSEGSYTTGLRWIHRDNLRKRIKQKDLEQHLDEGWLLGNPDWYKQLQSSILKNKNLIPWNKGKRIKKEEDYKTKKYVKKTIEEKFKNRSEARKKLCTDPNYIFKFTQPRKPLLKLQNLVTGDIIEIGREQSKKALKLQSRHIKALERGEVAKNYILIKS